MSGGTAAARPTREGIWRLTGVEVLSEGRGQHGHVFVLSDGRVAKLTNAEEAAVALSVLEAQKDLPEGGGVPRFHGVGFVADFGRWLILRDDIRDLPSMDAAAADALELAFSEVLFGLRGVSPDSSAEFFRSAVDISEPHRHLLRGARLEPMIEALSRLKAGTGIAVSDVWPRNAGLDGRGAICLRDFSLVPITDPQAGAAALARLDALRGRPLELAQAEAGREQLASGWHLCITAAIGGSGAFSDAVNEAAVARQNAFDERMDRIRDESRDAFLAGLGRDRCPYRGSAEPHEAVCWVGGWAEAAMDAQCGSGTEKGNRTMDVSIEAGERRNFVELGPTGSGRHLVSKAVHEEVLRLAAGKVLWIAPKVVLDQRQELLPGVDVRIPVRLLRMQDELAGYDTIVVDENHPTALGQILPRLRGHDGRVVVMFDPAVTDRNHLAELLGAPQAAAAPEL